MHSTKNMAARSRSASATHRCNNTRRTAAALVAAASVTASCQVHEPRLLDSPDAYGVILPTVQPFAETAPVQDPDDAADDSVILVTASGTTAWVMAADKTFGLRVYDLAGNEVISRNVGNLNNIDAVPLAEDRHLLAASNRSTRSIDVFEASIAGMRIEVRPLVSIPLELDDPYGLCMGLVAGSPTVFVGDKSGRVERWELATDFSGGTLVQSYRFQSQTEGCVFDRVDSTLYVGEEAGGIWAVNITSAEKTLVDAVGGGRLTADVEGLDIYYGSERLLVASSQGDNGFVIYRLPGGTPLTKFRITGNAASGVDGATETDGVAVTALSVRGYPAGLLVVQDGHNRDPVENQNFKLVDWRQIQDLPGITGGRAGE